ncbi:MAG: MFS transporter [Candidatus Hermodarchaeota archaeon]
MAFISTVLGLSTFPRELRNLSLKYFCLQLVVSGIYLSYTWISLYYLALLNSFSTFGFIVAIGMLCGAVLDVPLGILTDRIGQKISFCSALLCLTIYYLGLIYAFNPLHLILLEILVGIYSALISGSFTSWFMNSWESLSPKKLENGILFRNVMGNISFAKTIIVAFVILSGGFFLKLGYVLPQTIFFLQATIAFFGIILGLKFIDAPRVGEKDEILQKKGNCTFDFSYSSSYFRLRFTSLLISLKEKYSGVFPYFICFSILTFTSISFSSFIFSPLFYDLGSSNQTFNQSDIIIDYTAMALIFITMTRSLSEFIFAIFSRLSGKITSFIQSPYKGILFFYIFGYPVIWSFYICIMIIPIPLYIKLTLFISIYFFKIVLSGLSIGLFWQFYYKITSSESRSSQESLFNTISLLISLIGYGLMGTILESSGFIGGLFFLLILSCIAIFILVSAKKMKTN